MSRARDIPEKDVYMPGAVSDKVIAINRLIHITRHLYSWPWPTWTKVKAGRSLGWGRCGRAGDQPCCTPCGSGSGWAAARTQPSPCCLSQAKKEQQVLLSQRSSGGAHVDQAPLTSELRLAQPFPRRLLRLSCSSKFPPFSHTLSRPLKTTSRTAP